MRVRSYISVVLALAALASLGAGLAAARKPAPWSCNGLRVLCDRRFDRVVLPASHNSMSAKSLRWTNPNQPLAIPRQLSLGVRGFLWDTHYGHRDVNGYVVTDKDKEPGDQVYLCHELCQLGATPLIDVLRSFRDFARTHPHEVFTIVNEDYVTPADYAATVRKSGLSRYVYTGRTTPPWPTVRTMIQRRQRIVMLAEHHAGGASWYHPAYEGIVQETNYSWEKPELITKPSNWKASCAPNRGARKGSLFLMNHWSPPYPPATPAQARPVNAYKVLVGRAKECRRVRHRLPTLIAVDQFTSGALFRAVRTLNTLP